MMETFNNHGCGMCYILLKSGDNALLVKETNGEFIVAEGLWPEKKCWVRGHYFGDNLLQAVQFYESLVKRD